MWKKKRMIHLNLPSFSPFPLKSFSFSMQGTEAEDEKQIKSKRKL
jgi:hypothetical protein